MTQTNLDTQTESDAQQSPPINRTVFIGAAVGIVAITLWDFSRPVTLRGCSAPS